MNRNKRSLAIDLKSSEGRAVLMDLVQSSDVFVQNYRPGVAKRLGVDYESLSAINPALVYVSLSGYGEDGPYVNRPGQDPLLQGLSGAMLSAGRKGEAPSPAGLYLVDAVAASTAFEAVLAALLYRERTGEGQLVTVNMLDAITTLQMQKLSVYTVGGLPQKRSAEPHAHVYIRAPYGAFATLDGYVIIAMPSLKTFGEVIAQSSAPAAAPRFAYLAPALDLPFWRIVGKGVSAEVQSAAGTLTTYDSHNDAATQLKNAQDAIAQGVAGIVISPTDSSSTPSVLALAKRSHVPVSIAGIDTTSGDYVSFVGSDDEKGAYEVGKKLASVMTQRGWQKGGYVKC